MNNKATWAALAAMLLVTGLQSQHLFPEAIRNILSISTILLSGISIYRLFSILEKEKQEYRNTMLADGREMKEELQSFRLSLNETLEENQNISKGHQKEILRVVKESNNNLVEIQGRLLKTLGEDSQKAIESFRVYLVEIISQLQNTASEQQIISMRNIKDSLENMEMLNRSFEQIVMDSLKASEKQYFDGYHGIKNAIDSFSEKVTMFSKNTDNMIIGQNDMLNNFTVEVDQALKTHSNKITKSIIDAMTDLSTNNSEMIRQMGLLAQEYKRFEDMSEVMIDKMRMITEDDYALMKDIFKDDIR